MPRCLFVGSNGAGLGHVTRLLAIARRLPDDVEIVFASMSQAVPLLRDTGYIVEYIPTVRALAAGSRAWNAYFERRVEGLLRTYEPDLLAFDGTAPYSGLVRAMRTHPELHTVWVRRAMWRPGYGRRSASRAEAFDTIIEPGELADDLDLGATFLQRADVQRVRPILYHDADELLERDVARRELGLATDATIGLLLLGAGNINDTGSPTATLTEALRTLGVEVVVAESPIAEAGLDLPAGVRDVRLYPIAPYYPAFDLVIAAAGYNSFHELIAYGMPSLFVPNLETKVDDQWARAEHATEIGAALSVVQIDPDLALAEVQRLLDPETRRRLIATCEAIWPGNGAGEAASLVADLLRGGG